MIMVEGPLSQAQTTHSWWVQGKGSSSPLVQKVCLYSRSTDVLDHSHCPLFGSHWLQSQLGYRRGRDLLSFPERSLLNRTGSPELHSFSNQKSLLDLKPCPSHQIQPRCRGVASRLRGLEQSHNISSLQGAQGPAWIAQPPLKPNQESKDCPKATVTQHVSPLKVQRTLSEM